MKEKKIWVLFQNTRKVIQAEKLCKEAQIALTVMPVPSCISSECGMCILVAESDVERVTALLKNNHIECEFYAK